MRIGQNETALAGDVPRGSRKRLFVDHQQLLVRWSPSEVSGFWRDKHRWVEHTVRLVGSEVSKHAMATVGVVIGALLSAVRLLADAAETTPADDELSSSVRGGLLNFRTGKLDDGTDPTGWYEQH